MLKPANAGARFSQFVASQKRPVAIRRHGEDRKRQGLSVALVYFDWLIVYVALPGDRRKTDTNFS